MLLNPPLRQAANRYQQPFPTSSLTKPLTLNTSITSFQNQSLMPKPTRPTRRKTKEKQPTHMPTHTLHICFALTHQSYDDSFLFVFPNFTAVDPNPCLKKNTDLRGFYTLIERVKILVLTNLNLALFGKLSLFAQ